MSQLYFLISSLPALREGQAPPFSPEEFLSRCSNWLSDGEMRILGGISLIPDRIGDDDRSSSLARWKTFETSLRNRIIRTRKPEFQTDPAGHLRAENDYFSAIERAVQDAFASPDPFSREKILDSLRWKMLEDLEAGHIFDFDLLCIYMLKLMIIEKNSPRTAQKGSECFDEILDAVFNARAADLLQER